MSHDPRIIVALDCAESREALALADRLDPGACRLKVGLELFTVAGPAIVTALRERGFEIFLDLKYHDIPNTVARACARAADLGVWMMNVHALGGPRMLAMARKAVLPPTLLVGVTILTSHDSAELAALGLGDAAHRVQSLAHLCAAEGLDGVVCSPQEAALLRGQHARPFRLVTPGIRPSGSQTHDQRRVATGREALAAGADYLVIGRPITAAALPHEALAACRAEIGEAD